METVAALYRLEDRRRRREGVDPVFLTLVLALLALGLAVLYSAGRTFCAWNRAADWPFPSPSAPPG